MNGKKICNQAIYVGQQYRNYRGGIGAVLASYAQNIKDFKFVSTYDAHYKLPINILYFVGAFIQLFWKLSFDSTIKIVHLHSAAKGSFYRMYILFLMAKYIFGKKVIYHLHASEFREFYEGTSPFIRRRIQHIMNKSSAIICLSQYWYQYLNVRFHIEKLYVLNNPIHPPEELFVNSRENTKLKLLFLGIIGERKGLFDLLEVLLKNKDCFRDKLQLTIGGNGDTKRLLKCIKENELGDFVKFEGWVDKEKKHRLLSTCDVLVLPSHNEGLPISILEAMSYGKAILSSTVGGIPEVVKNNENGFLIEPGNIAQLKQRLEKLIKKPANIQRMGENSRNKVKGFFISEVIKQLETIYQEIGKDDISIPLSNQLRVKLLDVYRRTNQLKVYKKYLRNQFDYSKEDIDTYQQKKFKEIFEHHYYHNPAYRKFIESQGFKMGNNFSIKSIPLVTKDFFRTNPDHHSLKNKIAKTKHSSGSTGKPLTYHLSRDSLAGQWPSLWRDFHVYGVYPCDKILMIAGHSLFNNRTLQRKVYDYINNFYVVPAFDLTDETLEKAYRTVLTKNIKAIYAYTSGVLLFLQFLERKGYKLDLKVIFTTAELFNPCVRVLARKYCNCDVLDTYGANDGGVQAFECKHHTGYHVNFEKCFVEIIDGEIILTDLLNTAMPFIRYRVGDRTSGTKVIKERCKCGRSLFRIPDVTGRINQYIEDIDSNIVHTAFFNQLFAADEHIRQFQILQENKEVYINIIHDQELENNYYLTKYSPLVRERLKITVNFVFGEEIEKLPNMKVPVFWNKDKIIRNV